MPPRILGPSLPERTASRRPSPSRPARAAARERARRAVLHRVRHPAGRPLPRVRHHQPAGREVLRRLRDAARAGGQACDSGHRPRAGGRAPAGVGPVRRPGGLHPVRRGTGRRGGPRDPHPVLRPGGGRDRAVRRHGREVHRRRGDGRLGRPDRPRGRCRAGRARRPRAASTRSGRWDPRPRPGPGCCTGEAAVTIGATNQGMVAGDLVNTASRLQSVAPAGTVLVGEATWRAASRAIAFEPAGEQDAPGEGSRPSPPGAPCGSWPSVAGGTAATPWRRRSPAGTRSCGQLKDLYAATGRERRPRLVA